ncbi:helix-turn-helix domain-containing protein [Cohnella fermenti]|nr:helix-turn-helix domain-containing protein [Cohnella fermenti]
MAAQQVRKNVILVWIISYMAVLIVPLLFSVFFYIGTQRTLEAQIRKANDLLLNEIQLVIDMQVADAKRLATEIMWNDKVQDLIYSNKYERNDYRYDLYAIMQDLNQYATAYSSVAGFYLYWQQGKMVVRPDVYKSIGLSYEDLYAGSSISQTRWEQLLQSKQLQQFVAVTGLGYGGDEAQLLYIHSFPPSGDEEASTSIAVSMRADALLEMIGKIEQFNNGDVLLLNENGEVLLSLGQSDGGTIALPPGLTVDRGSFRGTFLGKSSQFSYIKSASSKLTYLTIVPENVMWEEAVNVRNLIYMDVSLSLLGGLLLTLYLVRRNYRPVRQLVFEKQRIQDKMQRQTTQLRSNFISRLLKGRIDTSTSIEDSLQAFQMELASERFGVLLIYLNKNEPFMQRIDDIDMQDRWKFLQFIVSNVVEEVVNRVNRGYVAEVDDMLACLVNLPESGDPSAAMQSLREAAEEVRTFLKREFKVELIISIGGIKSTLAEIPLAYSEALDAMEYKLIIDDDDIIVYEDLHGSAASPNPGGYYYPIQIEQKLINHVKVGETKQALDVIDSIMEKNFGEHTLTVPIARCLMFELVSTLMKTMNEIEEIEEAFEVRYPRALQNILACETVADIRRIISEVVEDLCQFTAMQYKTIRQRKNDNEHRKLIANVQQHIQSNYRDYDLNVTKLGDTFGLKATYLSKLFRDITGVGLLDYINVTRLEQVKKLLTDDKKPLQEVAEQCGFQDLNTFIRIFKKHEGLTPGKYKGLHSND